MTKHTIYIELDLEEGSGRIAEGSQALLAELVKVNPKGVEDGLDWAIEALIRKSQDLVASRLSAQ